MKKSIFPHCNCFCVWRCDSVCVVHIAIDSDSRFKRLSFIQHKAVNLQCAPCCNCLYVAWDVILCTFVISIGVIRPKETDISAGGIGEHHRASGIFIQDKVWFCVKYLWFNSSLPGLNGRHFAAEILKCILWIKSFVSWLKFHWSLFLRVKLTITQHWFR